MTTAIEYKVGDQVLFTPAKNDKEAPFKEPTKCKIVELSAEDEFDVVPLSNLEAEPVNVFRDEIEPLDESDQEEEEASSGKKLKLRKGKAPEKEETKPAAKKTAAKKTAKKKTAATRPAQEEKKQEVAEAEPEAPVITPEINKLAKDDAVAVAQKLVASSQKDSFLLGGVLLKIEQEKSHVGQVVDGKKLRDDKDSFEVFCDRLLGVGYRKARYLIKIYSTFAPLNITSTKVARIGYAKLKEVTDIVKHDPSQCDDMLKLAEDSTMKKLDSELKKVRKKLGIERKPRGENKYADMTKATFFLFEDKANVIEQALDMAKAQMEDLSGDTKVANGAALFHIVSEWMQNQ